MEKKSIKTTGLPSKKVGKVIGVTLILAGMITCVALIFFPQATDAYNPVDICIDKQADINPANVGQLITYTYTVTNCGDASLTNVSVVDDMLGPVTLGTTELAPGQSTSGQLTYTVIEDDLPGPIDNRADAYGTDPVYGYGQVTDFDTESVGLTYDACIELTKEADIDSAGIGSTITYWFNVTNCGTVTLSDVSVIDDMIGNITLGTATLTPGQTTTGNGIYVVIEDDFPGPIVNYGIAYGYDPLGHEITDPAMESVSITSNPPDAPSNPDPDNGETHVNINTDLSWKGSDPDGDPVTYDVYFGTSSPPPLRMHNQSSSSYDPSLHFGATYYWKIIAWDNHGGSNESEIWSFNTRKNNPPSKPTIDGPTTGHKNTSHEFSALSLDADNDKIEYIFNWGDGETDTSELLANGAIFNVTHNWTFLGIYTITGYAIDENNAISETAELTVLIDVHYCDNIGYLIDNNSDGIYDLFYCNKTGNKTVTIVENGTYLIDSDGDGKWDYAYTLETGLSTYPEYLYYQKFLPMVSQDLKTPGFEVISVLAMMALVIIILRRRRINS